MMMKFSLGREKDRSFNHIAIGLIPAASIAPKPAVPRTPPPRSPDPSPGRPRSALAAAILSSSLTGQTWALPPARPRSFSDSDRSNSCTDEHNISTLHDRDGWSDGCLASTPCLSPPDCTKDELEFEEKEEEDGDEKRINQIVVTEERFLNADPAFDLSVRMTPSMTRPNSMSGKGVPSPAPTSMTSDQPNLAHLSLNNSSKYSKVKRPAACSSKKNNPRLEDEQRLLEEGQHSLEQEMQNSQASINLRSSLGSQTDLQRLRQQAQELVDENDALKMTVHRLNVELSRYQTCFRPLSRQESSMLSGLPKTGSSPPWLLDMRYLSPLLLAYEERINEQDVLLQTTEKEVKRLRVQVEDLIKENEQLLDKMTKVGPFSQNDCHELQQQAILVLQENQVVMDQLDAQHIRVMASHSRHQAEVNKLSKQLMLLESEKQSLQEDLDKNRAEAQKYMKELQDVQAHLKDAVTWDDHHTMTWKLKRQLEQQESRYRREVQELNLRVSKLQEENRSLTQERVSLTSTVKSMEVDLHLSSQANSNADRRMSLLKQQREVCVLKEEKTRHYLSSVLSVAEHISQQRDQLLHATLVLQQEKRRFIGRLLNGTVRFGKLQEEVKVCPFIQTMIQALQRPLGSLQLYRRQALSQLAVLEEAAAGRTESQQKEILHLQKLLREREEAEETLLQSKREVDEELEVMWQAVTRENQQMKDTVLDLMLYGGVGGWMFGEPPDESRPLKHVRKKL